MLQLFRLFLDIVLLKKGPQDVPYSVFLFAVLFIIVFVLDIVGMQIPGPEGSAYDLVSILRYLVFANIIVIGAIYLVFKLQNLSSRFLQSITALTGAGLLLTLIQLPMNYMIVQALIDKDSGTLVILSMMQMFLFGWALVIHYQIFKQALSVSMLYAMVLSMGVFSLTLFLRGLLLPELSS